jgi:hypothetical protein
MLEQFIWFGGAKCSEILFGLKKLDVFEIHDSFYASFFDEFSHIWPSEQKVGVFAENARYIFCRSSKYLSCEGIKLRQNVLVFSREIFFKLV